MYHNQWISLAESDDDDDRETDSRYDTNDQTHESGDLVFFFVRLFICVWNIVWRILDQVPGVSEIQATKF